MADLRLGTTYPNIPEALAPAALRLCGLCWQELPASAEIALTAAKHTTACIKQMS